MSEDERRYNYRYDRVLIESGRVINPQLDGVTIRLSGAQVEMLRNLVHYLDRPTTFVAAYEQETYLVPDDDDWDTIAAIAAELEYNLMGNDNLPFGINARWEETHVETKTGAGTYTYDVGPLPAGYFYILQRAAFANHTSECGATFISLVGSTGTFYSEAAASLARYVPLSLPGELVLCEGDKVRFTQVAVNDGDSLRFGVWGYTVQIP